MRFKSAGVQRSRYEGTKQADAILRAARALFVREGAGGFSARRVAKEAGLSLGSVQHVFPTTEALLVAMLESVVTSYDQRYQAMIGKLPLNARARWEAVVEFLIKDVFDQDTRRLFFGFWALSSHNRLANAMLKEAYAYHAGTLAAFIAAVRPDLDEARCRATALQVAALIEGWMVFTAAGASVASRERLRQTLREGIEALVSAAQSQAPG